MKGDVSKKFHDNREKDSSIYEVRCEQVGRHRIWRYYIANAKQNILCGGKYDMNFELKQLLKM
jgi:hypothetical protein